MPVTPELAFVLHRHFITADSMQNAFHRFLKEHPGVGPDHKLWPEQFAHLSVWYATLYVVIEAWEDWGFEDADVETRLSHPNKALLKKFRNKTFHAQKAYVHPQLVAFIAAKDSVPWVLSTHFQLGRAILEAMGRGPTRSIPGIDL
jgi:hypothetical protein